MTAVVCGRCVTMAPASAQVCDTCHGTLPRQPLTLPRVTPVSLSYAVASRGARAAGVALTLTLCALAAVLVLGLDAAQVDVAMPVLFAVGAAALVATAQLFWWLRTGRAVGNVALRTRSVRADDAAPLGIRGLAAALRRHAHHADAADRAATPTLQGRLGRALGVVTVVVRDGRDPLRLGLAPLAAFDARPESEPLPIVRALELIFDEHTRLFLDRACILGREPALTGEDTARTVALPDLSRMLSKNHIRLDWHDGRLHATDLGSTNGSTVVNGTTSTALPPRQRTEIPRGAQLRLAGRPLRIENREWAR